MTNSATILIVCLLASRSDVSGAVDAQRDEQSDVTGILATVMDQLAVINEKLDKHTLQLVQLTDRVDRIEEALPKQAIQFRLQYNMCATCETMETA